MEWTQKKLEELYKKVNERAAKDPEFCKKILKDAKAALEETAGCMLPENLDLKFIEKDSRFEETYVKPDFADGEIDLAEMKAAAGGVGNAGDCGAYTAQSAQKNNISIALIVSICGAAAQIGSSEGLCGVVSKVDAPETSSLCAGDVCTVDGTCGELFPTFPDNYCGAFGCGGVFTPGNGCHALNIMNDLSSSPEKIDLSGAECVTFSEN